MNDFVYIGRIVNTHGIKGELRILSDFDKKELVFKSNFPIFLGKEKKEEIIKTYRPHKNFDMITLEGYENINEVLSFIKMNVYVRRSDLKLEDTDYLLEDLIGCSIIEKEENIGKIIEIVYNKANILLKVQCENGKVFYIPKNGDYLKEVDIIKKQVITQNVQGLIL